MKQFTNMGFIPSRFNKQHVCGLSSQSFLLVLPD